mgnify:CR=1 FL=1
MIQQSTLIRYVHFGIKKEIQIMLIYMTIAQTYTIDETLGN